MSECCDPSIDDRQDVIGKASKLGGVVADPDQWRPLVGKLLCQLFDGVSCFAVQCCSRFVSQNDHRARQQRAGNAHSLCLATREVSGVTVKQPGWEPDVIEHVECPILVDVGHRDPKVVEHGSGEKWRPLEHHGHLATQFVWPKLVEPLAPPPDLASEWIVETVEQPQEGGLARPGRAHDCGDSYVGDVDRDVAQNRFPSRARSHPTQRKSIVCGHSTDRIARCGDASLRCLQQRSNASAIWHAEAMAWLVSDARVFASAEIAENRSDRRRGLLGRTHLEGALVIRPCRAVHTLGMKFPIDVAFVDADGVVMKTLQMSRHRIGLPVRHAQIVIEAQAGAFDRWGLRVGDVIEVRDQDH